MNFEVLYIYTLKDGRIFIIIFFLLQVVCYIYFTRIIVYLLWVSLYLSGPGCSKLMTSLVNVSLKFQTLISDIRQYFLLKKCEKLLHCKSFSHFFNKKYQCCWL